MHFSLGGLSLVCETGGQCITKMQRKLPWIKVSPKCIKYKFVILHMEGKSVYSTHTENMHTVNNRHTAKAINAYPISQYKISPQGIHL